MGALITVLALIGLGLTVLSVYVMVLSISTMRAHRAAMHALHRKIQADILREQQASVLGQTFPRQAPAPEQEQGR